VGDGPIALGAIADVWEGTCRGKKVSIRCLKIRTENKKNVNQVRGWYGTSPPRLLRAPAGAVVILQTGRHLEKVKTSERCPFHRRYDRPFAGHLGVDAERDPDRVRREKPSCDSD